MITLQTATSEAMSGWLPLLVGSQSVAAEKVYTVESNNKLSALSN